MAVVIDNILPSRVKMASRYSLPLWPTTRAHRHRIVICEFSLAALSSFLSFFFPPAIFFHAPVGTSSSRRAPSSLRLRFVNFSFSRGKWMARDFRISGRGDFPFAALLTSTVGFSDRFSATIMREDYIGLSAPSFPTVKLFEKWLRERAWSYYFVLLHVYKALHVSALIACDDFRVSNNIS